MHTPTPARPQSGGGLAPKIRAIGRKKVKEQASGLVIGVGPAHKLYPACGKMSRDNRSC